MKLDILKITLASSSPQFYQSFRCRPRHHLLLTIRPCFIMTSWKKHPSACLPVGMQDLHNSLWGCFGKRRLNFCMGLKIYFWFLKLFYTPWILLWTNCVMETNICSLFCWIQWIVLFFRELKDSSVGSGFDRNSPELLKYILSQDPTLFQGITCSKGLSNNVYWTK